MEGTQIIKISPKALETFTFLLDFAKNVENGEITITFHNHDFDKLKYIRSETKLTGQPDQVDFLNQLTNIMLSMQKDV